MLGWVEKCLEIPSKDAPRIREEYAVEQFRTALAHAMDDGFLTDEEYAQLKHIASSVGKTAPAFARQFFQEEGEGFLQSMFFGAIEDGCLTAEEWQTLVKTSGRFGIAEKELVNFIEVPAMQFVEHVLADAKADEKLTVEERSQIEFLLQTLQLNDHFCTYVRQEMDEFELRVKIAEGRLPIVSPPAGIEIRAGELIHACAHARLAIPRRSRSESTWEEHQGTILLLDSRAIFQSETKSQSINYRNVISLRHGGSAIEISLHNKPMWTLRLFQKQPLFSLIFRKAVALANQTAIRRTAEGGPSRHIPRDVRQRVWQRYGAQCVDCGATEYLEFDHVIPVAKGGSNSDANVQLLCRRCNQKKSDRI